MHLVLARNRKNNVEKAKKLVLVLPYSEDFIIMYFNQIGLSSVFIR